MKNKRIFFHSDKPQLDIIKPYPASKAIPEWFRTMPGVSNDKVATVKKCIPFLDSMTSGYIIALPVDVTWDDSAKMFKSASKFEVVSRHHPSQTEDVSLGAEFLEIPFKWINSFYVKTPRGYSCLFVHPLNREDLPFHSISGVVDTDKHPTIINFPFVMKKGFRGVIPVGTPLIQVIPFKRDDWSSTVKDTGEAFNYPLTHEIDAPPFNWYKRKWWSRKRYS